MSAPKKHAVIIDSAGTLKTMHTDAVADLVEPLGQMSIERASHIEPRFDQLSGRHEWAVLKADGTDTGERFHTRAEALAWEVAHFWELVGEEPPPTVPGFAGIRIHAGNTEPTTEGCHVVVGVDLAKGLDRHVEAVFEGQELKFLPLPPEPVSVFQELKSLAALFPVNETLFGAVGVPSKYLEPAAPAFDPPYALPVVCGHEHGRRRCHLSHRHEGDHRDHAGQWSPLPAPGAIDDPSQRPAENIGHCAYCHGPELACRYGCVADPFNDPADD